MFGICETKSILHVGSLPCLWTLLHQIFIKIGSRQLLIVHKLGIRKCIAKVYLLLCEDRGCSYKNQQNVSPILPCIIDSLKEQSDLSFFVCMEKNRVVEQNESCHSLSWSLGNKCQLGCNDCWWLASSLTAGTPTLRQFHPHLGIWGFWLPLLSSRFQFYL